MSDVICPPWLVIKQERWMRASCATLRLVFGAALLAGMVILSGCHKTGSDLGLFAYEQSDLDSDPAVEYGVLPNGLRYAVRANDTPSKTAALYMRFDVGALAETDGERGLAHFLEHMAFNGSENIAEGEMIPRLEKFGLSFGADTNAYTSFDETVYTLELPDVSEDIINEAMFIMRETADKLLFEPQAIEKERGVVLSEKRASQSPAYDASIDGLKWFLKGSPYPDRLPIGTEDTINSVSAAQFRDFYSRYYRPESCFIVFVGDFDTDYAAEKIAEYFVDWQADGAPGEDINPAPLHIRKDEVRYYTNPEIETSVSINVMSAPDLRKDLVATRKARLIEGLGNRILSRRLSALAQSADAPFISAGASSSTLFDITGMSSLDLSSQPENWDKALMAGEQELRRAFRFGFTQAELDEQIANTRKSLELSVQSAETRRTSSLARGILSAFGGHSVITTPQSGLDRFETYADSITPEQVHESFKAAWAGYETPLIYLATSEIIIDAEPRIQQVYRDSQALAVEPNEQMSKGSFAYTDFGQPGSVAERQHIEDIDFEQIRFVNNVRLNIKKTPYEKNQIGIIVSYGRGHLALPEDELGLRWFIPSALGLGGLVAHSADEIRTLMAGKAVGASFSIGARQMFMSGGTAPDDLRDQMDLMMAYMTAPGFRAEVMARYDKYISSFYPTLDSTPSGVSSRDVPRLIRSGDVRFGIPSQSALTGVSMEELKDWMHPGSDDSVIEIGIVGDVDIEAVIDEVARTFATLPTRQRKLPKPDPKTVSIHFPPGSQRPVILNHAGDSQSALLEIYWPSPDGRDVEVQRRVNVLKSMFKMRLMETLREELGASYSPSAFYSAPRLYPGYGFIGTTIEVAPDAIDKAEARTHALAESFARGELDQDLLTRALRPIQENLETSQESNSYWQSVIAASQTEPEHLTRHRSREASYENMTLEELLPLAKQIFNRGKAVSYHIMPEAEQ